MRGSETHLDDRWSAEVQRRDLPGTELDAPFERLTGTTQHVDVMAARRRRPVLDRRERRVRARIEDPERDAGALLQQSRHLGALDAQLAAGLRTHRADDAA